MRNKRTWKTCTNQQVNTIFKEVEQEAKRLYPYTFEGCNPRLYIDSSKSALGRCITEFRSKYLTKQELIRKANNNQVRYSDGVILLSKYILHDMNKVRDILCHEFGHFVSPSSHHDKTWRARANHIGEKWGITNQRLDYSGVIDDGVAMAAEKDQFKYEIECPKCHFKWHYKTYCNIVKSTARYRCSKCNEHLIRTK